MNMIHKILKENIPGRQNKDLLIQVLKLNIKNPFKILAKKTDELQKRDKDPTK